MPLPIKPVHSLDLHAELFDTPSMSNLGLSDIQIQLMGATPPPQKQAAKVGERYMEMLMTIDKNVDEVVTAANQLTHNREAKVCHVPSDITDNELLALKTSGLLTGYGRSVSLTDKAKLALRDHYLSSETTNEFRKNRTKDKFDLNEAKSVVVSNTKFKKIATWLASSEFRDEFEIRFMADNDQKRTKGLMFAEPLEELEVVFFTFPSKGQHSFWNNNVDFSLSLAFLNKDFEIVDFKDLEKQSTKLVAPDADDVKYVVEAYKDIFKKLKINIGDKLILKGKKLILDKKT